MATPEQNALLALQLFAQPAQQFAQGQDARTNLLLRLAMADRDEQLRRDLTTEQGRREDARWKAQGDREDARITAAEKRQKTELEARQAADIQNEFDRLYPQYAAAAARAGEAIKPRTDFPSTREGLGQLAADLRASEVKFEDRRFRASADAAVGEVQSVRDAVAGAEKRLLELSRPGADEMKLARAQASRALKQAIASGELAVKAKGEKDQAKALAALERGELAIATELLGEDAVAQYDGLIAQTLEALPNTKARLQERAQAQQGLMALQRTAAQVESDWRRAGAANPFIPEGLAKLRTLQTPTQATPQASPPMTSVFESITPPRPAASNNGAAALQMSPIPALNDYRAEQRKEQRQVGFNNLLALAAARDEQSDAVRALERQLVQPPQFMGGFGAASPFPVDARAGVANELDAALAEQRRRREAYLNAARLFSGGN